MKVKGKDMLLPTMMVGNYPKPMWFQSVTGGRSLLQGDLVHDSFEKETLKDVLSTLVKEQELAGLDIISDCRIHSADSYGKQALYYYQFGFTNVSGYGPLIGLPIYSTLYAPTITGPIKRKHPIMTPIARLLRDLTDKPIKVQYTGVQALAQANNDKYYTSARDRAMDMAAAINEDVLELDALGVDYIQFDEFTWSYIMEDWCIEAFNRAVSGVKNAKIVLHLCFGNYSGTPGYFPDDTAVSGKEAFTLNQRKGGQPKGARAVLPRAYEAKTDILHIEFSRQGIEGTAIFKEFPPPPKMDICIGAINVKSTITETEEQVATQIREALKVIPRDRLSVSTDCGMILLQRYVAVEKLKSLVAGTKIVRAELS